MNDSQIISIAMVLAVLAGSIFNNVRIGDMSRRIDDQRDTFRAVLTAELGALRAEMAKNQSEMLHKFADLDPRLSKMEDWKDKR